MFYSAGASAFFDDRVHRAMPADAVRITAAQHAQLFADQAAGAIIQPDLDGRSPCARRPLLALSVGREVAVGLVKVEARRRIIALASIEQQTNDNALVARAALGNAGIAGKVDAHDLAAALGRRTAIDELRADSDRLEAEIATMDAAALAALDVAADMHWTAQPSTPAKDA